MASTEELASAAMELNEGISLADTLQTEMAKQVKRTEELLNFIKDIANNSNILGINAHRGSRAGSKEKVSELLLLKLEEWLIIVLIQLRYYIN